MVKPWVSSVSVLLLNEIVAIGAKAIRAKVIRPEPAPE